MSEIIKHITYVHGVVEAVGKVDGLFLHALRNRLGMILSKRKENRSPWS